MYKSYLYESNQPVRYESAGTGKCGAILGKLHAPFFDLNSATRNGRDYSEAAEDALNSELFKEKISTRTFFGRLGHPVTDEEMAEDPAVRACVVLTDYEKNPKTNMYEGTLEILNNDYGRQLKSLIDAGCIMGVSTRGSGDSYLEGDTEVITKGSYDFEALDVVTLPAVKAARCTVVESLSKDKRKSLESLIESTKDRVVLEQLKVTVESTEMPNKKELLESINKKLSGDTETIESLANDMTMLAEKLKAEELKSSELQSKLDKSERKLEEIKEKSAGTTETIKKELAQECNAKESYAKLLRESVNVIEGVKSKIKSTESALQAKSSKMKSLESKVRQLQEKNNQLQESLDKCNESLKLKSDEVTALKESLTETTSKSKSFDESMKNSMLKVEFLEKSNKQLSESYNKLVEMFIKSTASAYGISYESLKSQLNSKASVEMIESAAKSIRKSEDARRRALPDLTELGKIVENASADFIDDPELDRAGRVASLTTK